MKSENHRTALVGKSLWRLSCPTCSSKLDQFPKTKLVGALFSSGLSMSKRLWAACLSVRATSQWKIFSFHVIRIFLVAPCLIALILSQHASKNSLPSSSHQPTTGPWKASVTLSGLLCFRQSKSSALSFSLAQHWKLPTQFHGLVQCSLRSVASSFPLGYVSSAMSCQLHFGTGPRDQKAIEQMGSGKTKSRRY